MHPMRACIPGLPERGQPEANLETREWDGSDDVHSGVELRGRRNRIEQSWNGDRKNECLSGSPVSSRASARTKA